MRYKSNRQMERALATIPYVVPEHIRPRLKVTYRYGGEAYLNGNRDAPGEVEELDLSTS